MHHAQQAECAVALRPLKQIVDLLRAEQLDVIGVAKDPDLLRGRAARLPHVDRSFGSVRLIRQKSGRAQAAGELPLPFVAIPLGYIDGDFSDDVATSFV